MSIQMVNTPIVRARRWFAVVVLAGAAVIAAPQAFADNAGGPAASDTYVVADGETLWSISVALTPADRDVRDTVETVMSMNMLDSASIRPGDQLIVPLYG